jgi:hypothetical protein
MHLMGKGNKQVEGEWRWAHGTGFRGLRIVNDFIRSPYVRAVKL